MTFEENPFEESFEKEHDNLGWKKLMNFITNENKIIFRKSLTKINKQLYYTL